MLLHTEIPFQTNTDYHLSISSYGIHPQISIVWHLVLETSCYINGSPNKIAHLSNNRRLIPSKHAYMESATGLCMGHIWVCPDGSVDHDI